MLPYANIELIDAHPLHPSCLSLYMSVQQLCAHDQDTSIDRVATLLLASFEQVFGVKTEAGVIDKTT